MLRPELCAIHPNDHDGWAAFATAGHSEPWDEFAWFVLDVGLAGRIGTIAFQVLAERMPKLRRVGPVRRRNATAIRGPIHIPVSAT